MALPRAHGRARPPPGCAHHPKAGRPPDDHRLGHPRAPRPAPIMRCVVTERRPAGRRPVRRTGSEKRQIALLNLLSAPPITLRRARVPASPSCKDAHACRCGRAVPPWAGTVQEENCDIACRLFQHNGRIATANRRTLGQDGVQALAVGVTVDWGGESQPVSSNCADRPGEPRRPPPASPSGFPPRGPRGPTCGASRAGASSRRS